MVTVYSLPNCVQCKATTRQLEKFGIPYTVESAEENKEKLTELGFMSAPVVRVRKNNGEIDYWSGYNPKKIKELK